MSEDSNSVLKIDDLLIGDHYYLRPGEDECYYHMEYTSKAGYGFSKANDLIHNFKKPVSYRGKPPWRYKEWALNKIAGIYKTSLSGLIDLSACTLVPVPPSKVKTDPDYDDRMLRLIKTWTSGSVADIRELLVMNQNMDAAHGTDQRMSPDELQELIEINTGQTKGSRSTIVLLDDVLTTGAHFIACKKIIQEAFPDAKVIGVFAARTIWPKAADEFEDLLGDL